MKAITLTGFGGVEVLSLAEIDKPSIQTNQVLIKSKAISINPIDIKTRMGKGIARAIKDNLPAVIGWDISGVVQEVGTDVTQFKTGDEVFGMIAFPATGKTYAEYVVTNADEIVLKPANVGSENAAAACLAALTALQALSQHTGIQAGQRVLIHAGSGGVGHFAIQMAKDMGAYVITTSSEKNKDFVLSIGA
ncbi:MAG: NADP-dependent oxidoreductase, partial [Chitinophagaceae bacterium]